MDERDKNNIVELINKGMDAQTKFATAMVSVSMGSLALSYQFSAQKGEAWPYVLIMGWVCLFSSSLIGGWRLRLLPGFYFKNAELIQAHHVSPKHIEIIKKQLDDLDKIMPHLYNAQAVLLVIGLLLLGIFTSKNYLAGIGAN